MFLFFRSFNVTSGNYLKEGNFQAENLLNHLKTLFWAHTSPAKTNNFTYKLTIKFRSIVQYPFAILIKLAIVFLTMAVVNLEKQNKLSIAANYKQIHTQNGYPTRQS